MPPIPARGDRLTEGAINPTDAVLAVRARFWRAYICFGLGLFAAEAVVVAIYGVLAHGASHSTTVSVLGSMAAVSATLTIPIAGKAASRPWRAKFALGWSLLGGVLLTACAILDTGVDSPLLYLIVLPMAYAAVAMRTPFVVLCAVATAVEIAVVAATVPAIHNSRGDVLMLGALIAGTAALAVLSSLYRRRLESRESILIEQLTELAHIDGLTGCLNQRAFEPALQAEVDRSLRNGRPVSLLIGDVDFLKALNDVHGHPAGDAALAAIGASLRQNSRSFDLVARIGGDEFAIILPDAGISQAKLAATRLVDAVDADPRIPISLSIGAAELDRATPTARELLRCADTAMYAAKSERREGRGPIRTPGSERPAAPAEQRRPEDWDRLEERLRHAELCQREDRALLDTMLSRAPLGLGFVDRDCRLIHLNATLAAINGSTIDQQLGRRVADVVPDIWPQVQRAFQHVLATGDPVLNVQVAGETAHDLGTTHFWLANYYPVNEGAEIIGVGIVVVDITDRKRWETRRAALTESTAKALGAMIEVRDPYTAGHQSRVADLAAAIATELGIEEFQTEGIRIAASLHDIGKVAIPAEILTRPGKLRATEMDLIREHSRIGYDILRGVDFPWPVQDMVGQHHERFDGSGYPDGLRGTRITIGARIIAVADVLDAMCSHRPYRPAPGLNAAMRVIDAGCGRSFDPAVVGAVRRLIDSGRVEVGAIGQAQIFGEVPTDESGSKLRTVTSPLTAAS